MNDYPKFKINLLIYTRPNLRDPALEFEHFMGRDVLDSIFDKMKERKDVKSLFLSFPENWLNILEQRQLYQRLEKYCPNLKEITIKTHSVYIIQCTKAQDCSILDDAKLINEKNATLDQKLYLDMVFNLFSLDKINVVTPDGVKQI